MHTYSVQTVSLHNTPQLWEQLHASASSATVFSTTQWLTTVSQIFSREAAGIVLLQDDTPVAGIPLLTSRRGFLRLSTSLPISLYAGWLSLEHAGDLENGLQLLIQHVERGCHFVSLSMKPHDTVSACLKQRGWTLNAQHSRILELHDTDTLWNGYSQSLRRKIRRAEESALSIDTAPDSSVLGDCYEQSYQRHGIAPPIPREKVVEWLSAVRRQGMVHCYAAVRADGRCAATRVVIRDGDTLYDWLAGSNPTLAASASHWLLHSILNVQAKDGAQRFDFMGTNTPGVADFKRSFGGTQSDYTEAEWHRPQVLRHVNALRKKQQRRKRGI